MSRKINTLNDLNQLLENNNETSVLSPTEDFFEREAITLTKVDYFTEKENYDAPKETKEDTKPVIKAQETKPNFTAIELANYIHAKAKEENKSFAELWLEVMEEGAKKDMLIPFDKAIRTWADIPGRTLNIFKESMNTMFRM